MAFRMESQPGRTETWLDALPALAPLSAPGPAAGGGGGFDLGGLINELRQGTATRGARASRRGDLDEAFMRERLRQTREGYEQSKLDRMRAQARQNWRGPRELQEGSPEAFAEHLKFIQGAQGMPEVYSPFFTESLRYLGSPKGAGAKAGLMQTGQLLSEMGGRALSGAYGVEAEREKGRQARETSKYLRDLGIGLGDEKEKEEEGPGSEREEGGGIPKTGWYYLHKDEQVVPAPKTLRAMLEGKVLKRHMGSADRRRSFKYGTSGAQRELRSYQRGTPGVLEALQEAFSRAPATGPGGAPLESMMPVEMFGEDPEQQTEEVMPLRQSEFGLEEGAAGRRPSGVPPAASPESMQDFDIPGLTVGRGARGERSFKLVGEPEAPGVAETRNLEQEQGAIDALRETARGHARFAEQLLMYANQRPNADSSSRLRDMAKDRLAMGREIAQVAETRSKDLTARQQVRAEQEAKEVVGRMAAGAKAGETRASLAKTGSERQTQAMKAMGDLFSAYAKREDVEPEQIQALLMQLMQSAAGVGQLGGTWMTGDTETP